MYTRLIFQKNKAKGQNRKMKNKYYFPEAAQWVSQTWAEDFFFFEWGLSGEVAGLLEAVCVFCPGYFYWHFHSNPAGFGFVSCGYGRAGDQSRNGKTLHAKATGERKEQHYQLFPAEKQNTVHKPIVFTKMVFLELSAVWCLYATEGLLLIIHHGCWKPPPSHLIHIGNQHKSRLRKHITGYKTHKSQNYQLHDDLFLLGCPERSHVTFTCE